MVKATYMRAAWLQPHSLDLRTMGWRSLCITTFDFIMLLAVGIKHGGKQLLNVMTTDGMTFE